MKKLIATVAAMVFTASVFAGEFPDLSVKEVKALSESRKAVIIDVNGTESYKEGRVPGALDYEAIKDKLASVLPADKSTPIIAYCGNPKCKAYKEAAEAAEKLGYTNVKHMSAGIKGWRDAGEKQDKG
ncbi:MAG TPA: rhodanese-like domain-containing protein [Verrucomicrobiae bacterium]|nr:rhodanese-like domain-containing protein [Verrucomicrobiae bacterium]